MGLVKEAIRDVLLDRYISDLQNLNLTKEKLDKALDKAIPEVVDGILHPLTSITKPFWKL